LPGLRRSGVQASSIIQYEGDARPLITQACPGAATCPEVVPPVRRTVRRFVAAYKRARPQRSRATPEWGCVQRVLLTFPVRREQDQEPAAAGGWPPRPHQLPQLSRLAGASAHAPCGKRRPLVTRRVALRPLPSTLSAGSLLWLSSLRSTLWPRSCAVCFRQRRVRRRPCSRMSNRLEPSPACSVGMEPMR
jgi:hypothetical protein